MGRSIKRLAKTFNDLSEKKNELLMKYGQKNDKGQIQTGPRGVIVDPGKLEDFNRDYRALAMVEKEVEVFLIPFEALTDCKLNAVELANLVSLLCAEPDEPEPEGGTA